MTAPLRQPVSLHAALNAALGLDLRDLGEAREWLNAGDGWQRLEQWIKDHRHDFDAEEPQPEHEGEP